jgi:hypothetical protein
MVSTTAPANANLEVCQGASGLPRVGSGRVLPTGPFDPAAGTHPALEHTPTPVSVHGPLIETCKPQAGRTHIP